MAIIIHRNDENNPGDYWSRPNHYFNIGEEVLDIKDLKPFVEKLAEQFGIRAHIQTSSTAQASRS